MAKLFHFVAVFTLFLIVRQIEGTKIPCTALKLSPGAVISCDFKGSQIPCSGPINGVPKHTIAKYRCETESDFSDTLVECKCYGKWKGLDAFTEHTSACNSIQQKFSLNGPPELNLTKEEIQQLDGNLTNSNGNETEYSLDALAFHNFYRKRHGTSSLVLNDTLSQAAQAWAEEKVSTDQLGAEPWSPNKTYISNMYLLKVGQDNFDSTAAVRLAVGRFYSSGKSYNYEVPVASSFSAMMWNSSTDLGVGVASMGGNVLVVCNYWPPGNVYMVGGVDAQSTLVLFKKNVFPLLSNYTDNSSP